MLVETEFLKGISFEKDPFEGETPDEIMAYDLHGNEVSFNEAE